MTRSKNIKKFPHTIAPLELRHKWRISLRQAILCMLILALMPLWSAPQPAHARGLFGKLSKVIPFSGVVVGWSHRNRVYRSSERFIRDRNQYYDGLLDMARQQLHKNKITTVGRTRAAAYIKVYAMIEQERAGQLAVAEGRKRQARAQFQDRVKEAVIYAVAGGRIAQEVIGSMLNGVDSMQQMMDRALSKLTTGGSDVLQDLRRIKKIAYTLESVSSIIGGRAGAKLGIVSGKIAHAIEQAELGAAELGSMIKLDLQILHDDLFILKEIGRKPTVGEVINHVEGRFLPEPGQEGSIPLEAIATILSQLEVGDGSLKDEARRALNAGFAARCAEYSQAFAAQLESLKNSGQQESASDPANPLCKAVKTKNLGQQTEGDELLDELLEFTEDEEELPRVTASGTLSEGMSEGSNPMGTTFQLTADFSAGTINGTLKGSRTSTPRGWMNCYNPADPSTELDRIDVNTTDSYEASFSGSIDVETGEFSIAITPTVQTSATKVSLFTHEECLDKNSVKYPGEGGWNGKGTISGGVSKDGGIEFSTSWTYSWFYGDVQVNGSWSGNGIVASP
jgi:hypothetical protein